MNKINRDERLESARLIIRRLRETDVSQKYVDWLNDPAVNQYLAIKSLPQNIDTVRNYVRSYENRTDGFLLGVFDKANSTHMGNVTFSHIDWDNKIGAIGIAIGDVSYWGKGYATEALILGINLAFSRFKFSKLVAGIDHRNIASLKLFKRLGFVESGTPEEKRQFDISADGLLLVLVNDNR